MTRKTLDYRRILGLEWIGNMPNVQTLPSPADGETFLNDQGEWVQVNVGDSFSQYTFTGTTRFGDSVTISGGEDAINYLLAEPYGAPTSSLSGSPTPSNYEVGTSISSVALTGTITRNSSDSNAEIDLVQFKRDGVVISAPAVSEDTATYNYTDNNPVTTNTTFSIEGTDNQPNTTTSNINYNFIYPFFYGTSSTAPTADQALINSGSKTVGVSTGSIDVTFAASAEYIWFAVPATSTSKTSWYVDTLNNGDIGEASDLFGIEQVISIDSPSSLWSGQNYKIYVSNFATTTTGSMQLRN